MNLAILGTGNIGSTLGERLAASHSIVFGTRDAASDDVRALPLWISLATQGMGRELAFTLLRCETGA